MEAPTAFSGSKHYVTMQNYIDSGFLDIALCLSILVVSDKDNVLSHNEARRRIPMYIRELLRVIKKETGLVAVYGDGEPIKPTEQNIVKAVTGFASFVETTKELDLNKCTDVYTPEKWGDIDTLDHSEIMKTLADAIHVFTVLGGTKKTTPCDDEVAEFGEGPNFYIEDLP